MISPKRLCVYVCVGVFVYGEQGKSKPTRWVCHDFPGNPHGLGDVQGVQKVGELLVL